MDVSRGLAILGMLWVHFAPDNTGAALPDGRSAILFATLAGISLGLLTGGSRPPAGRARWAGYRVVAVRGVVLVVLGRLLVLLGTPIAVILDYYGVLFLLLLVVLFARRWVLVLVAAGAISVGAALIRAAGPDPSAAFLDPDPLHWPEQWLLTGLYPVALYSGFVAAGLLAARSDLRRRRTQLTMIAVGAILIPAGYLGGGALRIDAGAHANTTWEAIGSGGVAIAVIGLLQLGSRLRPVRVLTSPVADIGAMPLTIYTGQVVAAALFLQAQPLAAQSVITYWWLLAAMVGGSLLFAVVWRRLIGRGPMEQFLATMSRAGSTRTRRRNMSVRGSKPAPFQPAAAILLGAASGTTGALAVLLASFLTPASTTVSVGADEDTASTRAIHSTVGTMRLRLDGPMLRQAALWPGTAGAGQAAGTVITLPITDGEATWSSRAVRGVIILDTSELTFKRGADVLQMSHLLVDLEGGTAAGDLIVNGKVVAKEALLLQLTPLTPQPTSTTSRGVIVQGLRVRVSDTTAALMDQALGAQVFAGRKTIATASVSISGADERRTG